MTRIFLTLLVVSLFALPAEGYRLRYDDAEEVFSDILLEDRLKDKEWIDIIGNKDATYKVKPGDTLWEISARLFEDAYLWGKLWSVNPAITNPHLIEPGTELSLFIQNVERGPAAIEMVRLVPDRTGIVTDIDDTQFVQLGVKSHYRPKTLILNDSDLVVGEVSGSLQKRGWFSDADELYVKLDDPNSAKKGQHFSVIREVKRTKRGTLVHVVGEVEVRNLGEEAVEVYVVRSTDSIRRGDLLIKAVEKFKWEELSSPPDDLRTRIIFGEEPTAKYFAQGDFVLLNKGDQSGVKTGHLFRVVNDVDPKTETVSGIEPSFKGEVQVVFVRPEYSIGWVLRNTEPLTTKDELAAHQLFPDPPETPRRSFDNFEID